MSSVLEKLDGWWYAPAPAERLAVLRILIGAFGLVYLVVRSPNLVGVSRFSASQLEPVGPVALLSAPLPAGVVALLVALAIGAGAAFVVGWRYRIAGPAFALLLLWVLSYRNSWGMVFHTENLLVVHVLALGLAPAADAHALDARRRQPAGPDGRYGWAIRLMCVVTVIAYVIAGLAKLRNSGWDWVTSDILRNYIAYDNLRKVELGDLHSPLGAWVVRHAWVFPPIAVVTLVVELGAPVALLGRKLAAAWVAAIWAFHAGVLVLMAILFPYQLLGIGFAPFFRVERLGAHVVRRIRARR